MKHLIKPLMPIPMVMLLVGIACAAGVATFKPSDEVFQESLAKCKETAFKKPTKAIIVEKVNTACALLETEGTAAFSKFHGKDSQFLYNGTYIWVHDLKGRMRTHPLKPKMANGRSLLFLKDKNGKEVFAGMNKIVQKSGSGWFDYVWQRPGEKVVSQKLSFVKLIKTPDGEELVVGSGAYGSDIINEIKR